MAALLPHISHRCFPVTESHPENHPRTAPTAIVIVAGPDAEDVVAVAVSEEDSSVAVGTIAEGNAGSLLVCMSTPLVVSWAAAIPASPAATSKPSNTRLVSMVFAGRGWSLILVDDFGILSS
jgi:hypothetical protein